MSDQNAVNIRILSAAKAGIKSAIRTTSFLLPIMIPVSLGVALFAWSGALAVVGRFVSPAMRLIGLPGEAALVFVSSIFLNIYSAIAVIETLALSSREIAILAIMCLTAHNLIIETAVMKKTHSSAFKMVVMRLGWAIAAAWFLNLVLPDGGAATRAAVAVADRPAFAAMLVAWGLSTFALAVKVVMIVFALMIGQKLMEEFRVPEFLAGVFAPFMKFLGLPEEASFLWIVINVVGYAYGAGVVMERVTGGRMKPQEADLFNHHAALSHSLMEDTALFMAIGVPFFWLTVPRLAMAVGVVWFEKERRHRFRRSFRVGTK